MTRLEHAIRDTRQRTEAEHLSRAEETRAIETGKANLASILDILAASGLDEILITIPDVDMRDTYWDANGSQPIPERHDIRTLDCVFKLRRAMGPTQHEPIHLYQRTDGQRGAMSGMSGLPASSAYARILESAGETQ